MKKNWNNLADVRNYIEANSTEKVESFNGWELITDKNVYRLTFGKLRIEERE